MMQSSDKELGIIIDKDKDSVAVELFQTGDCDKCAGRFLCNVSDSGKRLIKVKYKGDIHTGDVVEVEQVGRNILKISLIQYGIPLFLFVSSVFITHGLLKTKISYGYPELISFSVGIIIVILSGFFIKQIFKKILKDDLTIFKIINVIEKKSGDKK